MRNFLLLLVIATAATLASCGRINKSSDTPDMHGAEVYKRISKLSPEQVSVAFASLTNTEKYLAYKAKFVALLEDGNLNAAQQTQIKKLLAMINPDMYEPGDKKEIFFNVFAPAWIKESSACFTKDQIMSICFTLSAPPKFKTRFASNFGEEACTCHVGDYCYNYSTFYKCHTDYDFCTFSSYGCGYLGNYSCDGRACLPY